MHAWFCFCLIWVLCLLLRGLVDFAWFSLLRLLGCCVACLPACLLACLLACFARFARFACVLCSFLIKFPSLLLCVIPCFPCLAPLLGSLAVLPCFASLLCLLPCLLDSFCGQIRGHHLCLSLTRRSGSPQAATAAASSYSSCPSSSDSCHPGGGGGRGGGGEGWGFAESGRGWSGGGRGRSGETAAVDIGGGQEEPWRFNASRRRSSLLLSLFFCFPSVVSSLVSSLCFHTFFVRFSMLCCWFVVCLVDFIGFEIPT